jgi:arsenate reductase
MIHKNKVYYLPDCDTSKRVIREASLGEDFEFHNLRKAPLAQEEIDALAAMAGSYEALFSRHARLYKERNLKNEYLNEKDYRNLLLEHYTFLKRPVVVVNGEIFIGGQEKVINQLITSLENRHG